MSIMKSIKKPGNRPVTMTICADAGMGKTTLAASFPAPIFVRAEDGMQAIPEAWRPDAFPVVRSSDDLWEQLRALVKEPHEYKTLVIDSVTALERLFGEEILAKDPQAKSLNQALGGYGAGLAAVGHMHQRIRRAAAACVERRGMNVVFIAHADTETVRPPDQEDYTRHSLRLNAKHSLAPYVDDVDVVGFLRLRMALKGSGTERKRAVGSGDRELVVHATPTAISKNRFGISAPLPVEHGKNPLASILDGKRAQTVEEETAAPAETDKPAAEDETADAPVGDGINWDE